MKVVFASTNSGKITELNHLFADEIKLISQKECQVTEVAETGLTFLENALIKARHASHETGLPALADDSGLVVPALKGAPGIYSARYAGKAANAKQNITKLLSALSTYQGEERRAFFYCMLVLVEYVKDPTPLFAEGRWQGYILQKPQGENGFGYDPIFYDVEHKMSAATLPLAIKNQVSHRAQAGQSLLNQLRMIKCQHLK
jgi:XTP/dITP diphosphohydrolase